MLHLKRYVWYYCFLVALNAYRQKAEALSPRTAPRKPAASASLLSHAIVCSTSSSLSSSCLFSNNGADDDGAGSSSDDVSGINDKNGNDFEGQASKISQPSKSDLYGDDELAGLLEMHQQLQSTMIPPQPPSEPTNPPKIESPNDLFAGGLHDLILQTVGKIEDEAKEEDQTVTVPPSSSTSSLTQSWISDSAQEKISKVDIIAVASDVDGTIIGSDQKIHPRTRDAIIRAAQGSSKLEWIFPATGKTRWGARNSLGPELSSLTEGPGVYVQGLYCLGNDGEVIFEKKLSPSAVKAAEQLVAESETSVVAYDGDHLYATDLTRIEVVEVHEKWGEPTSQKIPSLSGHAPGVHKLLLMDHDTEKLNQEIRPRLEKLAKENGCVVTQAIPTMLELLPYGCSKALGVQKLCEYLGIDPGTQLLTLGDAENDVEMLEISAIGVAVGNAGSVAKNAADIILPLTSNEGGVGMALEDILRV